VRRGRQNVFYQTRSVIGCRANDRTSLFITCGARFRAYQTPTHTRLFVRQHNGEQPNVTTARLVDGSEPGRRQNLPHRASRLSRAVVVCAASRADSVLDARRSIIAFIALSQKQWFLSPFHSGSIEQRHFRGRVLPASTRWALAPRCKKTCADGSCYMGRLAEDSISISGQSKAWTTQLADTAGKSISGALA